MGLRRELSFWNVAVFVAYIPAGALEVLPFFPVRLLYGSRRLDATCRVNVMVHPEYRGKGCSQHSSGGRWRSIETGGPGDVSKTPTRSRYTETGGSRNSAV